MKKFFGLGYACTRKLKMHMGKGVPMVPNSHPSSDVCPSR